MALIGCIPFHWKFFEYEHFFFLLITVNWVWFHTRARTRGYAQKPPNNIFAGFINSRWKWKVFRTRSQRRDNPQAISAEHTGIYWRTQLRFPCEDPRQWNEKANPYTMIHQVKRFWNCSFLSWLIRFGLNRIETMHEFCGLCRVDVPFIFNFQTINLPRTHAHVSVPLCRVPRACRLND